MNDRRHDIDLEWEARADDLAAWTLNTLVVRSDAYGVCRPKSQYTAKTTLTHNKLVGHYSGLACLGLHTTDPADDTCRWLALDTDAHREPDSAGTNWRFALHVYDELRRLGMVPLLEDSNGRGGFHHWVRWDRRVPAHVLLAFGEWLTRDHADLGVPVVEVFPKQIGINGRYGNFLRLPGKHKATLHYSRFWHEGRWLEGAGAVEHLLKMPANDPAKIPPLRTPGNSGVTAPGRHRPRTTGYRAGDRWWAAYAGDLRTLDIVALFEDHNLYVADAGDGRHAVLCPWHEEHTTGNGGTCVWEAGGGFPQFCCLHTHCRGRTIEHVLAWFGQDEVNDRCGRDYHPDPVDVYARVERAVGRYGPPARGNERRAGGNNNNEEG